MKKCVIAVMLTLGLFPFVFTLLGNRTLSSVAVDIGYLTRPLWDKEMWTPPEVPQFYSPDIPITSLCALNGWSVYNESNSSARRVLDVLIYAGEADMLELRIRELWDVVDLFLITEADHTFTGEPKPFYFNTTEQQELFAFAMSKIKYVPIYDLRPLRTGESPFTNEARMRRSTGSALIKYGALRKGDLYVMSDVDEVPYPHTLRLLKTCSGYPSKIYLWLNSYRYSFEFPLPLQPVKRSSVNLVKNSNRLSTMRVFRRNGVTLLNSGWHCSWCFRTVKEVRFKMEAYSHADRGKRYAYGLTDSQIQDIMCAGGDIFGLLPEAYTFKNLFYQLGPAKRTRDVSNVPRAVLEDPKKFGFLLPGNCMRK